VKISFKKHCCAFQGQFTNAVCCSYVCT